MKWYCNIGYGRVGAAYRALNVVGATTIAEDSGRGQFFGIGTGISVFDVPDSEVAKAAPSTSLFPWPKVNPSKAKIYFSHLGRQYEFVSNICEDRLDSWHLTQTKVFLSAAKSRGLAGVGHYSFPQFRFGRDKSEWRAMNDAAMASWRPFLTMLNPCLYGEVQTIQNPALTYEQHLAIDELLAESFRLAANGREKVVPYFAAQGLGGGIINMNQLRQRIQIAQAFNCPAGVMWSDQAGDPVGRQAALEGIQITLPTATYENASSVQ